MHLPFTPNHVHLVSACYPPSAALLTSGPEYLPNSQELSRLTYYASNRPGKINKLAGELEKRAKADCRRAQAGNTRSRASLLITLYIFKVLATECRRDIALLTASLMSAINATLSCLSSDLEVMARIATVFTAWSTYTDGHLIGVDREVTQDYLSCLQQFSAIGKKKLDDRETRNRTRLVGLASLTAAVHSEALYHASSHFKLQVSTILPALLTPVIEADIETLNHEAASVKEQPQFAFMNDFRTRPALERRAASIHLHVDGDKGPSFGDVVNAALHALSSLFGHSTVPQATIIMSAAFDFFDDSGGWSKVEHCRWFAAKAGEWTQYQYRYAVPTRLVECLVEGQDSPQASARLNTLAIMVTTVFTSPTPLVNLSTSDIISSLISLVFRRIAISPDDAMLPLLVECIASLGTHVYYTDQIQDLASELISRLVMVESSGLPGSGKTNGDQGRSQALRCLLAGLMGLMHASDMHELAKEDNAADHKDTHTAGTSAELPSPTSRDVHLRSSRRTRIPPEVWHDTLVLICDRDYAVRADYAVALVSYLQKEIPRPGDHTDVGGVKRLRPLVEGPTEQANNMVAMTYGDATTRFLNALHAFLYVLATSTSKDLQSLVPEHPPNGDATATRDGSASHENDQLHDSSRRSMSIPLRPRKTSFVLRAMQGAPRKLSPTASTAASLSDYGNILAILRAVHENLPVRGLFTGVPMLLALDNAVRAEDAQAIAAPPAAAIQQVIAGAWSTLGTVWSSPEITESMAKALSTTSATLPSLPDVRAGALHPPPHGMSLLGDSFSSDLLKEFDSDAVCRSLAIAQNVQETTGLDEEALLRRLKAAWSAESAFKESVEANANYDSLHRDGLAPLIKVAPALMHIDNISLQSLTRSTRGVGVTELRDALEGRSSISNPNLATKAPSISTLDHPASVGHAEGFYKLTPTKSRPQQHSKLAGPGEVRDVLNKLGIGKQNGATHLKSSFPTLQKPEQR
ncbi:hypothetical protein WOLCODRAFT_70616 [Wolfiporia cocos MD-104 SS10]|uniref:Protein EFR3 n=1 Tax=Wolfiporia cocos (strain MD-104) TaxID=742152 RepID=A0A2H3JHX0_WOLCO|nr:hypothetical protein WOLCODRAFT_70616 [Wolfiporia cocos MD-104 SS10]